MAWIVLFIKERFQNDIIRLIISTGVGVVAYFAVETLLKNEMCIEMWKLIKKKIRRTDIHE